MTDRVATWSLRQRLALVAVFVVVASIAFGGAALYWAASVETDQILDSRLEQFGATVLSFAEQGLDPAAADAGGLLQPLKTRPSAALLYRYQIWSRDGSLLMRSHEAPEHVPLAATSQLGFSTVRVDGEEYRVFALPSKDRALIVQASENISERWLDIGRLTAYYMGYLVLPFGVVFVAAWLLLRRAFRAVEATAHQLDHRNPLDLTPLRIDNPPKDLLPILNSIDMLFARVGQALSTERRFTSVAAHELRTPLAGLRAHAQLASAASDPVELRDALRSILTGVDRVSHLIDQLLDLARVEALPAHSAPLLVPVNIAVLHRAMMEDIGPKVLAKQMQIRARFEVEVVQGHHVALLMLLRNLLANAVLYSPVGSTVEVQCVALADAIALTIDDAGPGIRAEDRPLAFERFNRLGQSRVDGVGLGLSIVLSVVELHRARIELLESPLGGLRVLVLFGPVPDAADSSDKKPTARS
jgi:signal transduction histidine kinase